MRVMIIRKADAKTEAGVMPSERMLAAMGDYMKRMSDTGILLAGEGLKPSSASARVVFTNGKARVVDGPFAETKELVGGYALIRVESLDEAIEWAKQWPMIETETNVELELRPLYEEEDFGEAFTPELRKQEAEMRSKAAASQ
jgi:hypothetical protein